MSLSVYAFWVWLPSAVIAFWIESQRFVRLLAEDRHGLDWTPGFRPRTTWFSLVWALLRVLLPVLNSIVAGLRVLELLAAVVYRIDRPILKPKR